MSINQTEIFEKLEKLTHDITHENFIFEFLSLYGLPKSTITRLKKSVSGDNDNINVAEFLEKGEVANQRGIYFKPLQETDDVLAEFDRLKCNFLK